MKEVWRARGSFKMPEKTIETDDFEIEPWHGTFTCLTDCKDYIIENELLIIDRYEKELANHKAFVQSIKDF